MILNLENHKVIMHEYDYRRIMKYKEELHHCKAELESYQTNLKQHKEVLEFTRDEVKKYKAERNSLIDDLSWYKAKVSRLEQIRDIKDSALKGADIKIETLERENEKLRKANSSGWKQKDEIANKLISNIKSKNNLLSEFSQHIGNKPSSCKYKYFRTKLDNLDITEDEE